MNFSLTDSLLGLRDEKVPLTKELILTKTRVSSLDRVRNLNVWNQNLSDMSILSSLPNLEILSVSVNKIDSLESFQYCPNLKEIYLRNNEIQSLSEIKYLTGLKELRVLWLCGNPCVATETNYRLKVIALLPQLEKLDSLNVTEHERLRASTMYEDIVSFFGLREDEVAIQDISQIQFEDEDDKLPEDAVQDALMKSVILDEPPIGLTSLARLKQENETLKDMLTQKEGQLAAETTRANQAVSLHRQYEKEVLTLQDAHHAQQLALKSSILQMIRLLDPPHLSELQTQLAALQNLKS